MALNRAQRRRLHQLDTHARAFRGNRAQLENWFKKHTGCKVPIVAVLDADAYVATTQAELDSYAQKVVQGKISTSFAAPRFRNIRGLFVEAALTYAPINVGSTGNGARIEHCEIDGAYEKRSMGIAGDIGYLDYVTVYRCKIHRTGFDAIRGFRNSDYIENYCTDQRPWVTGTDGSYVPDGDQAVYPHNDILQIQYEGCRVLRNFFRNTTTDAATSVGIVKPDSGQPITSIEVRHNYLRGSNNYPWHLVADPLVVTGATVVENIWDRDYGGYGSHDPLSRGTLDVSDLLAYGNRWNDQGPAAIVPIVPVPYNSAAPDITGTAEEGETLTCSTGTWRAPDITYSYQWYRDGSPISGATANTHVVVSDDLGADVSCTVTATNRWGSATASDTVAVAAPPWTPAATLESGVTLSRWYDFNDTGTITTVSGLVSQITDKSGNAGTMTQGTSGNRPTYNATSRNSMPAAEFDGVTDVLSSTVLTNLPAGQAAITMIAAVYGESDLAAFRYFLNVNGSATFQIGSGGSTNPRYQASAGNLTVTGAIASNDRIIVFRCPAGSSVSAKISVDGGTETTGTISRAASTNTSLSIGGGTAHVRLKEIIILTGEATKNDVDRFVGYLYHKWGGNIASGHPYETNAPTLQARGGVLLPFDRRIILPERRIILPSRRAA